MIEWTGRNQSDFYEGETAVCPQQEEKDEMQNYEVFLSLKTLFGFSTNQFISTKTLKRIIRGVSDVIFAMWNTAVWVFFALWEPACWGFGKLSAGPSGSPSTVCPRMSLCARVRRRMAKEDNDHFRDNKACAEFI